MTRPRLLLNCAIFAVTLGSAAACGLGVGIDLPSAGSDHGDPSTGSTAADTDGIDAGPGDTSNEDPDWGVDEPGPGGMGGATSFGSGGTSSGGAGSGGDNTGGNASGGASTGGTASGGASSGGGPG